MPSKKLFLSSIIICVLLSFPIINSVWASSVMWSQTYGGEGSDHAHWLVETSDGGYAIAGYTRDLDAPEEEDFWLVKTDADGNMEWNQTYDYNKWWEHANFVVETADGGYAIAGIAAFPPPLPVYEFWLVKTDANGNMEWSKTYGETQYEKAGSVVKTSDGGFALAGFKNSFGGWGNDFWLVKTDNYGNIEWSQTHGGSEADIAHSLIETADGGYAIAGDTSSFGTGGTDFWLVKTDEYGNIPEFPSWAILPLLFIASFAAIICKQRLLKKSANN